jgi:sulfonate transport system substrate-binding protein
MVSLLRSIINHNRLLESRQKRRLKRFLCSAIIVFMVAVAVFGHLYLNNASFSSGKDNRKILRIATQTYPLYASINLAHELGFIDEELEAVGYHAQWTDYLSGPLVNEAVAAGEADVGHMADMPAINARSAGLPIQVVAGVASGEKSLAILVGKDSDINDIRQLRDKKIAYATGSYAQHLLALVLDEAGLTFSDIQSVNLGAADSTSALEAGEVDAIVIWEQYITKMTEEGTARVLIDGTGLKRSNMVLYTVTDYGTENPQAIVAFIKGMARGASYIKEQPREAARILAPLYGVSEDMMVKILRHFNFSPVLSQEDVDEILREANYARESGIIRNPVGIELIDSVYLRQAGY